MHPRPDQHGRPEAQKICLQLVFNRSVSQLFQLMHPWQYDFRMSMPYQDPNSQMYLSALRHSSEVQISMGWFQHPCIYVYVQILLEPKLLSIYPRFFVLHNFKAQFIFSLHVKTVILALCMSPIWECILEGRFFPLQYNFQKNSLATTTQFSDKFLGCYSALQIWACSEPQRYFRSMSVFFPTTIQISEYFLQ